MTTQSTYQIWKLAAQELQLYKKVAIAGLGEFKSDYQSSSFDPVANTYLPPTVKITFTENQNQQDIGFAAVVSQYHQITQPKALEAISEHVEALKSILHDNSEAYLELFGTFKGKPGFIVFKADADLSQNKLAFGLTAVRCKNQPIVTKKITIEKTEAVTPSESPDELRLRSLQELKKLLENTQQEPEKAKTKSSKAFTVIATVLTLILLINVAILIYKNPFAVQQHQQVATMDMGGQLLNNSNSAQTNNNDNKEEKIAKQTPVTDYTSTIKNLATFYTERAVFSTTLPEDIITPEPTANEETIVEEAATANNQNSVETLPVLTQNAAIGSNKNSTKTKADVKILVARAASNQIESGFYVVAGVFGVADNAANYKNELRKLGYKFADSMKPARFKNHMVYFQKFNNREDALESIDVFNKVNEDAWIYEAR